jgi:hypothetical protein
MNRNVAKLFLILTASVIFSVAVYQGQNIAADKLYEKYTSSLEQAMWQSGSKECLNKLREQLKQDRLTLESEQLFNDGREKYYLLLKISWPIIILAGLLLISILGAKWLAPRKST